MTTMRLRHIILVKTPISTPHSYKRWDLCQIEGWPQKDYAWSSWMGNFATSTNGTKGWQNESEQHSLNEATSSNEQMTPKKGKRGSTIDSEGRTLRRALHLYSPTDQKDPECSSLVLHAPISTKRKKKDDEDLGVTGAVKEASMGIKPEIATPHTHDVRDWKGGDAWSRTITGSTTRTSSTRTPVPTKETTRGSYSQDYMPRRKRLKDGNGPDTDGRDSPMRWTEHWTDENGAAGSAVAVETDQCVGGGAGHEDLNDSRLNFPSRIGLRTKTGGDDTFLTPYSISTMTDS